jgi:hypothetical protein
MSASCFAKDLTYAIDFSKSPDLDAEYLDYICGYPAEFTMDASKDLPTYVMTYITDFAGIKPQLQTIERSSGAVSGGDLQEPYQGDYRIRRGIATIPSEYYKFGIVRAFEVTTYGSPTAPKAFSVKQTALNYLESAELAEEYACLNVSYKLK